MKWTFHKMLTDGLFDLQVNGFAGVDFNDARVTAADVDRALEAMLASGVTGCLPTLITAHASELEERFHALDEAVATSRLGPTMVPGYHLEGPFLNSAAGYAGCHPADAMIDPDIALVTRFERSLSRPILLVTLAPERQGGTLAVRQLSALGKTVAIAHSAAGHAEVRAAAEGGLSLSTHLGNGLPKQMPKLENTLLAQLAEPRLKACLIADGHHLSRDVLGALVAIKGKACCILVTDAVVAAAAAPGPYRFAGMDVVLEPEGSVVQPGKGGLAGSALRLDQAVRNLTDWSIAEPEEAVRMASAIVRDAIARSLDHHGIAVDPGQVSWNDALEPTVISGGQVMAKK